MTYPDEDDDDRNWPIGELMDCYQCRPVTGMPRRCVALGPVTRGFDPTQTYKLECGHITI